MRNKQCDAVILAGGFGSRLVPVIGEEIPKPMALIEGVPLLEYQVRLCERHGFTNILVLVHHLSSVIKEFLGDGSRFGVSVTYSEEKVPRGTAGAIADALPLLSDVFIVIYGDTYLDVDLRTFYEAKPAGHSVVTFCHPNSHPYDSDLLVLDQSDDVVRVFRPNKEGDELYENVVNAALYVSEKNIFEELVPDRGVMDISSQLFPTALERGFKIRGYRSVEFIKDMGTPRRYAEVCRAVGFGVPELLGAGTPRKCVFLDRDGVINKEVGHLKSIDDFVLLDGVGEAVAKLNKSGYLVICVTNQPVVARGDLSIEELNDVHMKMQVLLGEKSAYLDDIFYCPHYPESGFEGEVIELKVECNCRKPKPGMLLDAAEKFNIDLRSSWMLGDHERDLLAGVAAGATAMYVGVNRELSLDSDVLNEIFSAVDLQSAVDTILSTNTAGIGA